MYGINNYGEWVKSFCPVTGRAAWTYDAREAMGFSDRNRAAEFADGIGRVVPLPH